MSSQAVSQDNVWIKVFGVPLNAWTSESFNRITDLCRVFIGVDEDTKHTTHLFWARICVKNSGKRIPTNLNFKIERLDL